jgi:hypothetical protein
MVDQRNVVELPQVVHRLFDGGVGEIAVALVTLGPEGPPGRLMMALRWNAGNERISAWQEDVGWFLVPFTFAKAIGKSIVEMRAFDVPGIDEQGFPALLTWLAEVDAVDSAMCY